MNLYQVVPPPDDSPQLSIVEDRDSIRGLLEPPHLPWVRALMVTNSRGDTIGDDGTSRSLTLGADRALLGMYREAADTVVVGASTIRKEPVPTPRHATLVVVTTSGNMSGHQLVVRDGAHVLVVTHEEASEALAHTFGDVPHTPLVLEGNALNSPEALLEHVSLVRPVRSVLIEGGRRTWEFFAPLTHEVCITVRPPHSSGNAGIPSWWPGKRDSWTMHSLWTDDEKMLYYRYLTGISARPRGHS